MSTGFGNLAAVRSPERPGPGKSPEALLKALDVEISRRMDGLMAGDHRSAFAGEGTELSRIRPYVPGDDVRRIDPNTTARMGAPHVRVEVAEKALTSWIVLDTSPSMTFGTADRRKADVAEGVVLAFGHLAARGANSVGLLTFGDAYPVTLPPRGGRMGTLGLLNVLRRRTGLRRSWRDLAGRGLLPALAPFTPILARGGRLGLPRPQRLAQTASGTGRTLRGHSRRDPGPERAGSPRRGPSLPGRPRNGEATAGRHLQPAAPGALRHRSGARARGTRPGASLHRRGSPDAFYRGGLAQEARDAPAPSRGPGCYPPHY